MGHGAAQGLFVTERHCFVGVFRGLDFFPRLVGRPNGIGLLAACWPERWAAFPTGKISPVTIRCLELVVCFPAGGNTA
jgi:hypothetical protein